MQPSGGFLLLPDRPRTGPGGVTGPQGAKEDGSPFTDTCERLPSHQDWTLGRARGPARWSDRKGPGRTPATQSALGTPPSAATTQTQSRGRAQSPAAKLGLHVWWESQPDTQGPTAGTATSGLSRGEGQGAWPLAGAPSGHSHLETLCRAPPMLDPG